MKDAAPDKNEAARLAALAEYNILDSEPDAALDEMVQLAAYICATPIAAISLIDEKRQWFLAAKGLNVQQTPRDSAFCAHTILQDEMLQVPDALLDERFTNNPLVTAAPNVRFYAGMPLISESGEHLGALCVIDSAPRQLNAAQLSAISILAKSIMAHLDLRLAHQRAQKQIEELQLAAAIFEASSEAMIVTDADNKIITVNPAFVRGSGYTREEVVGRDPQLLRSDRHGPVFYEQMRQALDSTGHWDGELWSKRKNGEEYAELRSINIIYNLDGTKRLHVATSTDITEKKLADELIWRHANYDLLTQIPNRRLFHDRLVHGIKAAQRAQQSLSLLFIDLDNFKEINDSYGHNVGDRLLIQVANRLKQCVRETDTVARMGGDEFTVILSQIKDTAYTAKIAENIIEKLAQPFMHDGQQLFISASIGVAIYPQDSIDAHELLRHADSAMYTAKRGGKNAWRYFAQVAELNFSI
jgi:diguanylate cyclase (GGDEF)-like protein/PAS domain S-box-containing protein